jgi:hypothetical protein
MDHCHPAIPDAHIQNGTVLVQAANSNRNIHPYRPSMLIAHRLVKALVCTYLPCSSIIMG